jgi:hypothetical protein
VDVLGGGAAAEFEPSEPSALALGVPEAEAAADVEDALEMMELASLDEIVVVVVLFEAEDELLPELVRTDWPRLSDSTSMKAMVGPAIIVLVA